MRAMTQPLALAGRALMMACALLLCALWALAPLAAQAPPGPKSLEELMAEVEDEQKDEQPGQAPAPAPEGERVKSLEELMAEVEGEEPGAEAPGQADVEQAAALAEAADADGAETHSEGPDVLFLAGLLALVVALIALGVPLYVLIGSLAMYLLFFGGIFTEFRLLTAVVEQTRGLADQAVLLAVPFFVIAGAIMTEGDIARRLINFAEALFGRLPGGLAVSAVFACAFFAAISGSSPVTVIAIGTIMYPALIKKGYPDKFSVGLVTSAGSLGILIPPSIPMIVYAIVDPTMLRDPVGYTLGAVTGGAGGESSVKDLFIAGVIPGLLIAGVMALYAMFIGWRRGVETSPFDMSRVTRTFREGFWALFLPVLILGGIYTGIFTPTQAAAVAVVYALAVEFFIHRSLKLQDLPRIFAESAVLMGTLLIIMALALGFNLFLDRAKLPEKAVEFILDYQLSIITFLLIVNLLLIVVGFFMDILSAILILVPLLAPIAYGLGIHPLHMAIIFIVNLEIGYLSPPIGLNLFVAGTLFKKGLGEVVRSVVPYIALMLGCLLLITYVPSFSLGLVSVSRGGSFYVPFPTGKSAEAPATPAPAAPANAAPVAKPEAPPEGVKSLEELMEEVEAEEAGGAAPAAPAQPERVKSLEELMEEVEAEQATP